MPHKAESASERQVADWIRQNTVYVGKSDRDIIGGVVLDETEPDRVKLSRLGVHATWKRKGVGSQ